MTTTSCDAFLGGRLQIEQPTVGYRAATDPVFLAAAIDAKSGQTALELGCGVGVASLCLAARVPGLHVTGLEVQPAYADLARRNAARNDLPFDVIEGDLTRPPEVLKAQSFHHVLANPPYYRTPDSTGAADPGRDIAHRELSADLAEFIDAGLRRLRPGGWLTLIQRTDRLPEMLAALTGRAGDMRILPLCARSGRVASRVILRARKGAKAPLILYPPLVVHRAGRHIVDGSDFSARAEKILRHGKPLKF